MNAVAAWTADDALDALDRGAGVVFVRSSAVLEGVVRERSSGRWECWYGGAGATYARREDGKILRSLRRLGECLGVASASEHEECAAIWTGYLSAFGLPPSAGLVGLVEKLAPQLRHWRQDRGQGERWRERLCLAGRAECLASHVEGPIVVYDLASAYPWAYSGTLPGELRSTSARDLPAHDCCTADVDLEVPESSLPPLPCEGGGGGWAWPVGAWRGWLAGPELHLARELGLIRKIHRVWIWEQASPLERYAHDLYALRKEAPDKGIEAVLKLLLNSTFGLLASKCQGRILHIRPKTPPPGAVPVGPEIWQATPTTRPKIYHPLAAAVLTSRVRERLWRTAAACERPLYLGVDGLHTPLGDPGAPQVGTGLGAWRGEGPWLRGGTYLAPGRYVLRGAAEGDRVRHQGLPGPEPVELLARYGEATVVHEGSPLDGRPGYAQRLDWAPSDGRWVGSRCYAGGDTRPCTVDEWRAAIGAPPPLPDLGDLGDADLLEKKIYQVALAPGQGDWLSLARKEEHRPEKKAASPVHIGRYRARRIRGAEDRGVFGWRGCVVNPDVHLLRRDLACGGRVRRCEKALVHACGIHNHGTFCDVGGCAFDVQPHPERLRAHPPLPKKTRA